MRACTSVAGSCEGASKSQTAPAACWWRARLSRMLSGTAVGEVGDKGRLEGWRRVVEVMVAWDDEI